MLLECYDSFEEAKKTAISYCEGSKLFAPLVRKEFRVYFRHGKFQVWSGRRFDDFPSNSSYLYCCKLR